MSGFGSFFAIPQCARMDHIHINHPATAPVHIFDRQNHEQGQRWPAARPAKTPPRIIVFDDHVRVQQDQLHIFIPVSLSRRNRISDSTLSGNWINLEINCGRFNGI